MNSRLHKALTFGYCLAVLSGVTVILAISMLGAKEEVKENKIF